VKPATPLDRAALEQRPLPPVIDGGKETKGRLLVVAGSRDVPGAALLCATAAMRAGAGKLRIATVESAAMAIGVTMPEAMVTGLSQAQDGGFARAAGAGIANLAGEADAVIAGPGVRDNDACAAIARRLMEAKPALALDVAFLEALQPLEHERSKPPILLPNGEELAALLDCDEDEAAREPLRCARRASELYRAVVLAKGVTSHVVAPTGACWAHEGGAPGLGVSGSGDVLAGIVGGLLARGAEPLDALLWAVWLHGQAGANLARKVGPIGFLAREIAGEVPALLPG
jgi:hydroxyethylthiazole kinase-like uncharacterized protein yjeF